MIPVIPAQLIVFVLRQGKTWNTELVELLENSWGPLRHRGEWHSFDQTGYYTGEMGEGLYRAIASFDALIDPGQIALQKKKAMDVEKLHLHSNSGRTLNLDVGYMDPDKIVLPSCKAGPWKVYWGEGIWLDIVMHYSKGNFSGSPWSFEDFVRNPYQRDLVLIREKYKKALKVLRSNPS